MYELVDSLCRIDVRRLDNIMLRLNSLSVSMLKENIMVWPISVYSVSDIF